MKIQGKMGTHSLTTYRVRYKRRLPVVGELIAVKEVEHMDRRWMLVRVTKIVDLGHMFMYMFDPVRELWRGETL